MTLFEECLVALGNNVQTMGEKETKEILETMAQIFPMTSWGKVDWDRVARKHALDSIQEGMEKLEEKKLVDEEVYILWDEASLPAIKTNIQKIVTAIYDVTAVSFDTWIFSPTNKYLIEFYHENEITLGFGK